MSAADATGKESCFRYRVVEHSPRLVGAGCVHADVAVEALRYIVARFYGDAEGVLGSRSLGDGRDVMTWTSKSDDVVEVLEAPEPCESCTERLSW